MNCRWCGSQLSRPYIEVRLISNGQLTKQYPQGWNSNTLIFRICPACLEDHIERPLKEMTLGRRIDDLIKHYESELESLRNARQTLSAEQLPPELAKKVTALFT